MKGVPTSLLRVLLPQEGITRLTVAPPLETQAHLPEVETTIRATARELREVMQELERYRAVVRNLPKAAVALFDRDLRFLLAEGAELMSDIGIDPSSVVGRTVYEVASPANAEAMAMQYRRTLEGSSSNFELERNGRTISIHTTPVRDEHGEIVFGMMTSYDVTAFRAVERALTQQTQLVGLLQAVTFAANAAQNSEEAMQVCLEEVCGYMGWPIGHVYFGKGELLVPSRIWHFGDALWGASGAAAEVGDFVAQTERTSIARGEGFLGEVLESGRSRSMTSLDGFLRAESASAAGIRGGFALPVLVGSEVAAVLEFYTMSDEAPDANALAILSNVGTQIGRVIERERSRDMLEAHAAEVRSMSARDELTGLYNRRGFFDVATQQLALAERSGAPAVLFFADLDGMKPINDQLGHEEGDRALVDTANLWRRVFRGTDVVARLGGDEFVLFAVGIDQAAALELRERVSREIEAFNALGSRPYRLSVSLGAAFFDPAQPRSLEALVAAADASMYEHKKRRA